jgi:hypothetical protein
MLNSVLYESSIGHSSAQNDGDFLHYYRPIEGESCTDILTTSYWFLVELGKKKYLKNKMTFIF